MKPVFVIAGIAAAIAAVPSPAKEGAKAGPVLAELFTSQSCSSCPPAEAFFSELAEDTDVVTLEWHVDYWDRLVYGQYGAWKDPFSDAAFTERQRRYNATLRGTRSVYTPQAIVGGQAETTGSRRQTIRKYIAAAPAPVADIDIDASAEGFRVTAASPEPAEIWVAYFDRDVSNDVPRGENHGRELGGKHVVRKKRELGRVGATATRYQVPAGKDGQGCAVVVQAPNHGPVYAAAYCPG